jgi:acetyl esterase/lipase
MPGVSHLKPSSASSSQSAHLPPTRCAGRLSASACATLLLSECSPATALNFLAWRRGVEITHAIAYGTGARRTLDVYRPRAATASPVIVFFYGGSWQSGRKETYLFVAATLARHGYVTIVPDYRVYPEIRYPGFLEDGALAVRWAKDNAAHSGGDPEKLFVMGHSAGAYIAAMLALDARWLQNVNLAPNRNIAGLIGISGPYDFLPLRDDTLKAIFGGANEPATQPLSHVSPGAPPALLLTGAHDRAVDPGNASRLAARLRAVGDDAIVKAYPWVGHLSIIGTFALPLRFLAPVLHDVDGFIAKTVGQRRSPPHAKAAS